MCIQALYKLCRCTLPARRLNQYARQVARARVGVPCAMGYAPGARECRPSLLVRGCTEDAMRERGEARREETTSLAGAPLYSALPQAAGCT